MIWVVVMIWVGLRLWMRRGFLVLSGSRGNGSHDDGPCGRALVVALQHGPVHFADGPSCRVRIVVFQEGVVHGLSFFVAMDVDAKDEAECLESPRQTHLIRVGRQSCDEDRVVAVTVARSAARGGRFQRRRAVTHARVMGFLSSRVSKEATYIYNLQLEKDASVGSFNSSPSRTLPALPAGRARSAGPRHTPCLRRPRCGT